jgi:hypothetical protein
VVLRSVSSAAATSSEPALPPKGKWGVHNVHTLHLRLSCSAGELGDQGLKVGRLINRNADHPSQRMAARSYKLALMSG